MELEEPLKREDFIRIKGIKLGGPFALEEIIEEMEENDKIKQEHLEEEDEVEYYIKKPYPFNKDEI